MLCTPKCHFSRSSRKNRDIDFPLLLSWRCYNNISLFRLAADPSKDTTLQSTVPLKMMKIFLTLVTLILAPVAEASGAVTLTLDTFDELRAGRNAFVKFHASWCGHCKAMKADWDKLGDAYGPSSSVLIGDVECTETDEGKAMCEKFAVSGYPTIKVFTDGDVAGTDYSGGRDLDSLLAYTKDSLEIKCDVKNPVDCDDKEKDYIEKMKAKSSEDRAQQIKRLSGMSGNSMKAELKQWLSQRLHILKSLERSATEEL